MAKIKVHVLIFHSISSHIEIVLENISAENPEYYNINRWYPPLPNWSKHYPESLTETNSEYSFDIEADPDDIINSWRNYWFNTRDKANILGNNCAVASQWFLKEYAKIPQPNLSNVSCNHLALGVFWPSFIPCPITLPGRIMDNAKFHVQAKTQPKIASQYSCLFLCTSMAVAALIFAASIYAMILALTILNIGIAFTIVGCTAVTFASSYGFFSAYNILSAINISAETKKDELSNLDRLEPDETSNLRAG